MLFIPGIVLTLLFASMENNRLNQDQFNKVFYSQIPMAYLGINFLIVIIMSVISYNTFKILESNDQQIKHPENEDSETTRNYLTFENEYHSHKREGSEERLNKKSKEEPKSKLEKSRNSRETTSSRNVEHALHNQNRSCFNSQIWKWICLIFFPFISTWLSSISTMFVRVLSGFGSSTPPLGHHTNFYGPLPIFYVFLILFCSVLSYFIINIGLKHYDSVYIAPLFKIGGMLHNLLSGGVLLNEFGDYSHDHKKFAVFLSGIIICIIGISLLIFGYKKSGKN